MVNAPFANSPLNTNLQNEPPRAPPHRDVLELNHSFGAQHDTFPRTNLGNSYLTRQQPFSDSRRDLTWTHVAYDSDLALRVQNPPPQPAQHRVYILRCAHCDMFLSNRGMRAVLLLRPHITLFSTDAVPSNCGALYSSADDEPVEEEEQVERTCDCLTQSLGCFGCGNMIGYQIVVPCTRCTASASGARRAANGHRYVFHHNEITYSERKHKQQDICPPNRLPSISSITFHQTTSVSPPAYNDQSSIYYSQYDIKDGPISSDTVSHTPRPMASHERLLPALYRRAGDTVYWHHLPPAGELDMPVDPLRQPMPAVQAGR